MIWIVRSTDLTEVAAHFKSVSLTTLVWTLPVIVFNRWLMSAKWNLLLKQVDIHLSEWACLRIYMISSFVGLFLPATVGADLSRAALARYEGAPFSPTVSSIVVERVLGFLALIFMAIVGVGLLGVMFADVRFDTEFLLTLSIALLVFFVGGIAFSFTSLANRIVAAAIRYVAQFGSIGNRLSGVLANIYETYISFGARRSQCIIFFVLCCIENLSLILLAFITARAMGVTVPLPYFLAFIPVLTFVIRMPVSIDGIGIYEKGMQYFLLQVGVTASLGLATGVMFHLVCLSGILPGGLLLAFYRRRQKPTRE